MQTEETILDTAIALDGNSYPMPMSHAEMDAVLKELDGCSPLAWLAIVRFMAKGLEANQELLAEILFRETNRRLEKRGEPLSHTAEMLAWVLSDVGLRIAPVEAA